MNYILAQYPKGSRGHADFYYRGEEDDGEVLVTAAKKDAKVFEGAEEAAGVAERLAPHGWRFAPVLQKGWETCGEGGNVFYKIAFGILEVTMHPPMPKHIDVPQNYHLRIYDGEKPSEVDLGEPLYLDEAKEKAVKLIMEREQYYERLHRNMANVFMEVAHRIVEEYEGTVE